VLYLIPNDGLISFGETELTMERFVFARTLEMQRTQRVDALPASNSPQN